MAGRVRGTADFFYREAQRVGYVARSAFKLLEIQRQFQLITPGASILDLGCAPGAWLQVACQHLGPLERGGAVVGVDLKDVKLPSSHCDSRVTTLRADVMSLLPLSDRATVLRPTRHGHGHGDGFSVVLSDMCPSVSGIPTKDAALSCQLAATALSLALGNLLTTTTTTAALSQIEQFLPAPAADADAADDGVLTRGGSLVIKFLESEDVPAFGKFCKPSFRKVSWLRPKATRSASREIYLICQGLK